MSQSQSIFRGVFYFISETVPLESRNQLTHVLDTRGASPVPLSDPALTHFITPSLPLEDFVESLPDNSAAHIVTPRWAERSAILASLQDPEYYSADPAYIFSGVTACATDISQADTELLSAAISALGGQWRTAFTRDVTHLFALAPGSVKYETAMHFKDQTGVCVLVPHWFDDTVRLGIRDLPTRNYEWPKPRVFQRQLPEGRTLQEDEDYEPSPERMMLYDTALSSDEQRSVLPASRDVWNGKRILLGLSLDLSDHQRKALSVDIRRQGGEVVELSSLKSMKAMERVREELEKVEDADIFVTRFRTGAAYAKAYQLKKTIGTLAWLWYVRASGTLTRPADQLLHYPIPDKPADGFDKEVITVTNYTGKDREYLKKLITLMGGEFTASMSAEKNTVVVAAYLKGTKTDKATSWSIPIVNHTWVEDCFVQWRRLTPARDKYIVFPPGVDFSTVLADRGLGRITWEPGQLEEMQRVVEGAGTGVNENGDGDGDVEMDAADEPVTPSRRRKSMAKSKSKSKSKSASVSPAKGRRGKRTAADKEEEEEEVPPGTAQSVGEVEDAVAVDERERDVSLGGQMDVDADFADLGGKSGQRDEERDVDMDGDEEAGPSNVPITKKGPPGRKAAREKGTAGGGEIPEKRRLVRRYTPRKTDVVEADEQEEEEEEEEERAQAVQKVNTPPLKRMTRTYASTKAPRSRRGERADSPSPSKRPRRKALAEEKDVEERSSEEERPKADKRTAKGTGRKNKNQTPGTRATNGKGKEKMLRKLVDLTSGEEEEEESSEDEMRSVLGDLLTNGKGKKGNERAGAGVSPSKTGRTPQRLHSVLVPSVASVYASPTKGKGKGKGKETVAAEEEVVVEERAPKPPADKMKVGPPQPKKSSRKSLSESAGVDSVAEAEAEAEGEAGPSRAIQSTSPTKLGGTGRTPSRRTAATKATEKLHNVIMPDVLSFQKEMKKGVVRATHEQEAAAGEKEREKGKGRGRKRPSMGAESVDVESEDDQAEEEMPDKKKRKTNEGEVGEVGKGRGKKKGGVARGKGPAAESEEPEVEEVRPPKKAGAVAATASGADGKAVRVMTTQLTLADDVVRALTRLGVKIVTKPSECTHLLVRSVVRTEKFLCAMAVAPYVLSEKWAVMSAANRKLLPEASYAVEDRDTEKKYNFNLADALKRAKKSAGKLFGGITFYITPKVPIEHKLLKNVVTANGGQVAQQQPTVRILTGHENRIVISSPEDVSIWRPLALHHRIYTQELILTSALRQEIDWEDTSFQVSGSFE